MVLDNEEHRALLLEMMDKMQFAGSGRKLVYELGKAIETATVEKKPE